MNYLNLSGIDLKNDDNYDTYQHLNNSHINKNKSINNINNKKRNKNNRLNKKQKSLCNKTQQKNIKKIREGFSQNVQLVDKNNTEQSNDYLNGLVKNYNVEQKQEPIDKPIVTTAPIDSTEERNFIENSESEKKENEQSEFNKTDIDNPQTLFSSAIKIIFFIIFCFVVYVAYSYIFKKENISDIFNKFNIFGSSSHNTNQEGIDKLAEAINKSVVNSSNNNSNVIEMNTIKPVYHGGQSYINDKNLFQDITNVLEQFSTSK